MATELVSLEVDARMGFDLGKGLIAKELALQYGGGKDFFDLSGG